ncbi:MAG: thiamine pyrophosphate-binding protein [Nitrospirae bacterium]|nr:thiamine pyrophosphate-binding protein [Nitrospirota bacterium]
MSDTVADFIVRFIEALGSRHVFGIPGAHILPVYDSLHDSGISTILAKHEQGAAFMAGGCARATGGVGVCIATAGPGATNLVTGVANAQADRLPVLAITGESPTYSFGRGALQESSGQGATSIDQSSIFGGISRYHRIVERADYLDQVFRRAYSILTSPNPGPVVLSFPYNVLRETVSDADGLREMLSNLPRRRGVCVDTAAADRLPAMLAGAHRPVIVAGNGANDPESARVIRELSSRLGIPVATSLKARGVIPETDPLSLGVIGITSRELAMRYITEQADLLILAGVSFGERTSYNWRRELTGGKKIVRIDNEPDQFLKVITPDLAVLGDVRAVLKRTLAALDAEPAAPKAADAVTEYKKRYPNPNIGEEDFSLIRDFLAAFSARMGGGAMIFDDNILYMQNFVSVNSPGCYFPNSGISSLGHAIPAAIGARAATGRRAAAILGDGGFQMCCMELMTAVNHDIPLTVVLLNNSSLGLVRKNQHYNYRGRYISCDFKNPDYALMAESFGVRYAGVSSTGDIASALDAIDPDSGVNLIEVFMSKDSFPNYSSGR